MSSGNRLRRIQKTGYWGATERYAAGTPISRRGRGSSGTPRGSSTADEVLRDMHAGKRDTPVTDTAGKVLRDMHAGRRDTPVSNTADQVLRDMHAGRRDTPVSNTADEVLRDMHAGRRL